MSGVLRVAIAGYGLAGEVFHAPLIAATEGLQVVAVTTSDGARAARARAAYPGVEVAADAEALVRDVPAIDLLVVATPNRRWDGDFLTVRRIVESGELGAVTRLESRYERFRPQVGAGAWRELPAAEEGGGLLLDLGAHLVDQALTLFGYPQRVYAEIDVRRPGARVEDDVFVALEHPGGVRSHLWMSAIAPLGGRSLRVSGTLAGVHTPGLDPQEDQLASDLRPGDPGWGAGEPARFVDGAGERVLAIERGAYKRFYAGVRDALRDGTAMPVDARDSVAALRVIGAARRSARTAAVIDTTQEEGS